MSECGKLDEIAKTNSMVLPPAHHVIAENVASPLLMLPTELELLMGLLYLFGIGFALYGVFAALRDFSRRRELDETIFRNQLASFRERNPEVEIQYSGSGAHRYYVISRASNGRTVFEFQYSQREAKRRLAELKLKGGWASISWIGQSQELTNPWCDKV